MPFLDFIVQATESVGERFSKFTEGWDPSSLLGDALEGLTSTALVDPLMEAIVTFFYKHVADNFILLIDFLLSQFSPSSNFAYEMFGITDGYNSPLFNVFYYIATALLFSIFVFNLICISFGPVIDQKNGVFESVERLLVSAVLILAIRPFLGLLNTTADSIADLTSATIISGLSLTNTGVFDALDRKFTAIFLGLFLIILFLAILIEFIKLVLSIVERYIVVFLLHIASPVGACFFVSRSTSSICSNYIRMYIAQLFLLIMNKFFLYMFVEAVGQLAFLSFIGCLSLIAFLKCAQRIDGYMKSLGLSVAQTGRTLLGSLGGGIIAMGAMIKGGRSGAGFIGQRLAVAGAKSGDFGMTRVGTLIKGFSTGQPVPEAKSFSTFGELGGFANISSENAKANKAFLNLLQSGNYRTAMNAPARLQTSAIKSAFTAEGDDIFKSATGFHTKDIKSAQVMYDGSIKGVIMHQATNGKSYSYNFTASPSSQGIGNNVASINGPGGKMYVSTSPTENNDFSGIEFSNLDFSQYHDSQVSEVASVTGAKIDNRMWQDMGVKSCIVNEDNILIARTANGDEVAACNLATGSSYYKGINSNPLVKNPLPPFSATDILSSPVARSLPAGASVIDNSFVVHDKSPANYHATFDWKSNTESGQAIIKRPAPDDLLPGSKTHLVNMGKENGHYKVTIRPRKQSNTKVPK